MVRLIRLGRSRPRRYGLVLIIWAALGPAVPAVRADVFADYTPIGSFELPIGSEQFAVLPDGRVLSLAGDEVYVETGPGSRTFDYHGVLPNADIPSFGAAFIRVSPDGAKIAVGNNGGASGSNYEVGVFALVDLAGTWFSASHWRGQWYHNTRIALTAGVPGFPSVVTMLDTTSMDPANPTNPMVIDHIQGASAGIAFDAAENLYTGNGFSLDGRSGTGAVKAFDAASWMGAWTGGETLDFETEGTLIVDVLSADTLGFDVEGNLHVGGGDGLNENGFGALVHSEAVSHALGGQGEADPEDPTQVRRLDPDVNSSVDFYAVDYSAVRGELYLKNFGETTIHVYTGRVDAVPAVSVWGLVLMTLLALVMGTLVFQRDGTTRARGLRRPAGLCQDGESEVAG